MKIFGFSFNKSSQIKAMDELSEYYRLAEEYPDDMRVRLRIAEGLLKLGKKGKAIEEYIHAAEGYEHNNLSQIAAAIYKQILQIDPSQVNVYQRLVDLHLKEGFIGDAIAAYEKLALYYFNNGERDEAFATLKKMVAVDPQNLYVRKKIERFCTDAAINPSSVAKTSSIENWELFDPLTSGRKQEAKVALQGKRNYFDLEAALREELISDEDAPVDLSGLSYNSDEGQISFDEIFKELRKNELADAGQGASLFHYNLGIAYQMVGRYDEAIEEIEKALSDPQRRVDCYLRLAVCYREKNEVRKALKCLKKGLHTDGLTKIKMMELLYEQALAYKKKGKKKKALKILRAVHEINSTFRNVEKEIEEIVC